VDNPPGLQLTGREAGEHATRAVAGRLLLIHLVSMWGTDAEAFLAGLGGMRPPASGRSDAAAWEAALY
jgi:hypothetical protein